MKQVFGSIWVHYLVADHFVCLTTNGMVKQNGEAVMGRGNAQQATITIPKISFLLGEYLRKNGNVAGFLRVDEFENCVVIFPVKHNWWEEADLLLIALSTRWLDAEAHLNPHNIYHLPRPGCGNGKRDWDREVKPIVKHLPDNVWIHHI